MLHHLHIAIGRIGRYSHISDCLQKKITRSSKNDTAMLLLLRTFRNKRNGWVLGRVEYVCTRNGTLCSVFYFFEAHRSSQYSRSVLIYCNTKHDFPIPNANKNCATIPLTQGTPRIAALQHCRM